MKFASEETLKSLRQFLNAVKMQTLLSFLIPDLLMSAKINFYAGSFLATLH